MVPTSHLSTISFYFILRSMDVWVSTRLASSILLAISALFFHREPSAGTHSVIVFAFISETKCWNSQRYCLCSRSSFQGILRAAAHVTSDFVLWKVYFLIRKVSLLIRKSCLMPPVQACAGKRRIMAQL